VSGRTANVLVRFRTTDYQVAVQKDCWTIRPNVDITHTLQGRIKDFAEERDLTLSEAYTELLEAGLDTLETQDQQ
jgi:phenylacetate-coenzyme A ligase PaaK-like adenylate-forming protein